jgi:membrane associated rhomboid family serine protease
LYLKNAKKIGMPDYRNNGFLSSISPVTRNILIINFIICAGCWFIKSPVQAYSPVVDYLGLHYFLSQKFYIYQLITYMFTHVKFDHLFFNMFALFMFGSVLERAWGPKRYLIYYLVTGIGAGLIQLLVMYLKVRSFIGSLDFIPNPQDLVNLYNSLPPTIGASGAVFGLLLAFGMLFPNAPLFIMFIPVPVKAKYMVVGYGLLEFFFGVANRAGDNVAHFAHLGGMLFGIFMILYWKKKDKKNGHLYF